MSEAKMHQAVGLEADTHKHAHAQTFSAAMMQFLVHIEMREINDTYE